MNDVLSRRERKVYAALHGVGLVIGASGFLWYAVADRSVSYFEVIVWALFCLLVPIFGYALQSDTRVIYGVRWLRSSRSIDNQ
jgi:hypothetical protein